MNVALAEHHEKLKILIADDNNSDRLILQSIVKKQGHDVVTASDGEEAVAQYEKEQPQIILLDALMPKMDGFEAARQIKQLAGEELVPIIFLTSLKDVPSLTQCLNAGGDDFLSKPYNRLILQAKINAFNRMRKMHATLQEQRDQIAINNRHLLQEQEVAKMVFDNVAHAGCLDAPCIKYMLSPLAVFNGDVLLAAVKPSGGLYVLLGDFTGHGLPAAIGAMPLAELFYSMTSKGFAMQDILREINQKLTNILPMGVFCCACMVDVNFQKQVMKVWIGGLPECYLYKKQAREIEVVKSRHLPLGVLRSDKFKVDIDVYELAIGDRFYMWSDGIHEATNEEGQMFGQEGVDRIFLENQDADKLFDEIKNGVQNFIGESTRDDDLTLLEVAMVAENRMEDEAVSVHLSGTQGPTDWSMTYELKPATLKEFNPLPLMLHMIMEVPGLRPHNSQVYTILAELYSNALEHGVIGLCSGLKNNSSGFMEYYNERSQRLNDLQNGFVRFHFTHESSPHGGILTIRVEDSGAGFDYSEKINNDHTTEGYCGRGIPLIRTLTRDVRYIGKGNEVEVVYEWKKSEH